MKKTRFTNDELASIYDYLQGTISNAQLNREIGRTRTNTYYYLGRALEYWLEIGLIKFPAIEKAEDLGGREFEEREDIYG